LGANLLPSRHYISQTAKIFGVSQATLRIWEARGLIQSSRDTGGYRVYSPDDVARIARIVKLRRDGVNLAGIQSILQKEQGGLAADRPSGKSTGCNAEGGFVGRRLRQLRIGRKISIVELARTSGLSSSFLSLVERGMSGISSESLAAICSALEVDPRKVLLDGEAAPRRLIRAAERQLLPSVDPGIRIEQLTEGDNLLDCQLFTVDPGISSQGDYAHEGEEFVFVLSGILEITVDQVDKYILHAGDSLCFKSTLPHRWHNSGKAPVSGIWINVAPKP
jgi:DNA-binding transcriptional MerR regulator/quercetin dioxygenase-like cupin family protein